MAVELATRTSAEGDVDAGLKPLSYIVGENHGFPPEQMDVLRKAYAIGAHHHRPMRRASGEPYFMHCIEVAKKTFSLCPDTPAVAAALLHDTLEDTGYTYEQLAADFPAPIPMLVDGLTKLREDFPEPALTQGGRQEPLQEVSPAWRALLTAAKEDSQAETLRKMMIATGEDVRVLVIKLCDRLHNIQTVGSLAETRRQALCAETLEIYAPLAHMLGMAKIRAELEDVAFRELHPAEYRELAGHVTLKRAHREKLVGKMSEFVRRQLAQRQIQAEVTGRPKHLYSIWLKMNEQKLEFDQIYDLLALRVLVPTVGDCYSVVGVVHNIFNLVNGRFKDYIARPKPNGYQSIHTTVIGLQGERMEIQIRTHEMHRVAEEGIAAHWKYKTTRRFDLDDFDEGLRRLRQIGETLKEVDASEVKNTLKYDLFRESIYLFSPQGKLVELPKGATPIDFAYHIHSEVGNHCNGARVDGKMAPLAAQLRNGQTVEIVTNARAHPTREWLELARTSSARAKIKRWLKQKDYDGNIGIGRAMIVQRLKGSQLGITADELDAALAPVLASKGLATVEALYAEVGFGSLKAGDVVARLNQQRHRAEAKKKKASGERPKNQPDSPILIEGTADNVVRLAGCCHPVQGEPIVGFVTIGRGVTIHRQDCKTIQRTLKQEGTEARDRILSAEWRSGTPRQQRMTLNIVARDRSGLLADVSQILKEEGIYIVKSVAGQRDSQTATLNFVVAVADPATLPPVLKRLRSTDSILRVATT